MIVECKELDCVAYTIKFLCVNKCDQGPGTPTGGTPRPGTRDPKMPGWDQGLGPPEWDPGLWEPGTLNFQ